MTLTELFVANVRRLMRVRDPAWTQAKLAEVLGMKPSNVTTLLKGSTWPSQDRLQRVADALGVKPYELLMPVPEAEKVVPKPKPKK